VGDEVEEVMRVSVDGVLCNGKSVLDVELG